MFFLAYVFFFIIILFLFFYLFWRAKFKERFAQGVQILTYHKITDDFDWGITRQKVDQFERGIKFLHDQGYKTASLEETLNPPKDPDRKVVITFDDGYEDLYLNAFPILQKYDFTACIFVVTGYIGKESDWDYAWGRYKRRHLSWRQIEEMLDAGFCLGSHTVNHPDLTKISKQFVEYELRRSKEYLEDRLGKRVDFLSYPFGRYNAFVQEEAERLGYRAAYTLCVKNTADRFKTFAIPRWGVYLLDSPLTLKIKLSQSRLLWIEDMKGRIINLFPSWTTILKGSPNYEKLNTTSKEAELEF